MDRLCRICMAKEGNRRFKKFFDEKHKFAENLFYVSEIAVFEIIEELPALICGQCEVDLEKAARIKKISLETEAFLKTMLMNDDVEMLASLINQQDSKQIEQIKEQLNQQLDEIDFNFESIKVEVLDEAFECSSFNNETFEAVAEEASPVLPNTTEVPPNKSKRKAPKTSEPKEKRPKKKYTRIPKCPCPVEGCKIVARDAYTLRDHMTTHSDAKTISCPLCGNLFKTAANLRVHRQMVHADPNVRYICDVCGGDYADRRTMLHHINLHFKPKPICHQCGKTFSSKVTLRGHLLCVHGNGEKKFECSVCSMKFFRKQKWKQHLDTHGKKEWQCQLCDKAFTRRYLLGEHVNKVHNKKLENAPKKHVCILCGKAFDRKSKLQDHLKTLHDVMVDEDA